MLAGGAPSAIGERAIAQSFRLDSENTIAAAPALLLGPMMFFA
jgi:hypothetical protein